MANQASPEQASVNQVSAFTRVTENLKCLKLCHDVIGGGRILVFVLCM